MAIDTSRSSGVFNASTFNHDIHVIGVGATGSYVVRNLILHGIMGGRIHVYDFDKVEEHNVSNQTYVRDDVGKYKVEALKSSMYEDYGEQIRTSKDEIGKSHAKRMSGVVFLLVDSFKARREIMKGLKFNPQVKMIITTRIDARIGYISTIDPMNLQQLKWYESTLGDDDDPSGEVSVCGTRQTVSATVQGIASGAVWSMMTWANNPDYIGNSSVMCFEPLHAETEPIRYKGR